MRQGEEMSDGPVFECCGGTCRLAEIRRMTEDELMDALAEGEQYKTTHLEQQCPKDIELRVAARDDLLIRREDYDAAVERAYRMFRSWLVEDNDAPLRSAVKAALAAAEGGET